MRRTLGIMVAAALSLAASPNDIPRDPNASPWLQKKADYLEAMSHFSYSATQCGQWTAREQDRFRDVYFAAAGTLSRHDEDYALELFEEGAVRAANQLAEDHRLECSALAAQDIMGVLRDIIVGRKKLWTSDDAAKRDDATASHATAKSRERANTFMAIGRTAQLLNSCRGWTDAETDAFTAKLQSAIDPLGVRDANYLARAFNTGRDNAIVSIGNSTESYGSACRTLNDHLARELVAFFRDQISLWDVR